MDTALNLIRIYIERGTVDAITLKLMFRQIFKAFPEVTLGQQIEIFMKLTKNTGHINYQTTWTDLGFPIVNPLHNFYCIVEDGEAYPVAYRTYLEAVKAVKEKHADELRHQLESAGGNSYDMVSDVDIPENREAGRTELYIEKGIWIRIYRIPVPTKES